MKKFLASLFFFVSLSACAAPSIEIGIGAAHSQPQQDGIWRQEGLPNTTKLNSQVFLLGVTNSINSNLNWHIDYVYLGHYSVNSWDTTNDSYYNAQTHQCVSHCDSLANFIGSGTVQGIKATIEAHTNGKIQYGIQGGPFLYYSQWDLSIPNYGNASGWPENITNADVYPLKLIPGTTTGGIYRNVSGWKLGFTIGSFIRYDNFTLSLDYYNTGKGWPITYRDGTYDGWPPLWKSQFVLMVVYQF